MSLSAVPSRKGHSFDSLELYAAAIDTSDYVARVAPVVRWLVPKIGPLSANLCDRLDWPDAAGLRLDIPRQSAVLVWGKP